MHFDGAQSKRAVNVGIVLTPLSGKQVLLSYRLEFECTNNVAKYEGMLLGLERAHKMGARNIKVIGDLNLVVLQVNQYDAKNTRLKEYRDAFNDVINSFEAFSINSIPQKENEVADTLVVLVSLWTLDKDTRGMQFEFNSIYRLCFFIPFVFNILL